MKISAYICIVLCITTFGCVGCQSYSPFHYRSSAFLETDSGFSRQSRIAIKVDPEVSIEFRNQLGKVETAAKKAGLHCTSISDAEYLLFITTTTYSHPAKGEGFTVFGIEGKVYRLTDGGKKRKKYHVWDGSASGIKDYSFDYDEYIRPPWVDVDKVVEMFVDCIGIQRREGE